MTPMLLPGFSRHDLALMFARSGYIIGAEIGVRQGAFSEWLCQVIPGLHLLCVDPWENTPGMPTYDQAANYAVAAQRLKPFNAVLIKQLSMTAVQNVPLSSLDFVYIDGNHRYEYVRDDLEAWSQRVLARGIVSGDDYDAPGVQQAVHEFVAAHGIERWWLTDDPRRRNAKGEVFTSWFWIQP